jgi:hypothetical protein
MQLMESREKSHTDKYKEITNDWNCDASCTRTSPPVWYLENFKRWIFVARSVRERYIRWECSVDCPPSIHLTINLFTVANSWSTTCVPPSWVWFAALGLHESSKVCLCRWIPQKKKSCERLVLTAVKVSMQVFWAVTPCGLVDDGDSIFLRKVIYLQVHSIDIKSCDTIVSLAHT